MPLDSTFPNSALDPLAVNSTAYTRPRPYSADLSRQGTVMEAVEEAKAWALTGQKWATDAGAIETDPLGNPQYSAKYYASDAAATVSGFATEVAAARLILAGAQQARDNAAASATASEKSNQASAGTVAAVTAAAAPFYAARDQAVAASGAASAAASNAAASAVQASNTATALNNALGVVNGLSARIDNIPAQIVPSETQGVLTDLLFYDDQYANKWLRASPEHIYVGTMGMRHVSDGTFHIFGPAGIAMNVKADGYASNVGAVLTDLETAIPAVFVLQGQASPFEFMAFTVEESTGYLRLTNFNGGA